MLRAEGWDVVWVWEELSPSALDLEILDHARKNERSVLTQDLDFSALLALNGWDRPSLGQPTVRGIRITVAFIAKMVNNGDSVAEILEWYPMLEEEDIRQAIEYARTHLCEA